MQSDSSNISLDDAKKAKPVKGSITFDRCQSNDEDSKNISSDYTEVKLKHKRDTLAQKIGWIGKCIGSGSEKANNIAFITILLCISLLILVGCASLFMWLFTDYSHLQYYHFGTVFFKVLAVVSNIITLCLGYIFGSKSK